MSAVIALSPQHLALVRRLLREFLPAEATVRVFGSRVTGKVKPFSDLDLIVDAGRPLSLNESATLAEAFSESDLPWKVDVVDRRTMSEHFWRLIEPDSLALRLEG